MICKKCGSDISRDEFYCPVCGEKVERQANEERQNTDDYFKNYGSNRKETPKIDNFKIDDTYAIPSPGPRKVFAIIGLALGIFAIAICWLPLMSIFLGIAALIFSVIGIKSNKRKYAVPGVIVSAIATVICLFTTFGYFKLIGDSVNSLNKRYAIRDAEEVFHVAKEVIFEEVQAGETTICTKNGDVYSVTLTALRENGEIEAKAFKDGGDDGGMTVYYDSTTGVFDCTLSGTVNTYKLAYKDGQFKVVK